MQQDGGTAGVEPTSPHPSPHQTSLRAQSLPASFLRARGPALLAQAELHVRRVYPRDFRARPQPPPPRRPRPSTPPHIREAAQCRAYATRGENRAERRRSAVRAGRPLGLRVAARRTARGRGWRAGAGPSVRTRWDRHRVGGVEEDGAGVRQARRRLGTRPAFLERLWAKRALPVSLLLLSCCFSLSSGLVQCRPHASSSLAFVKPLRLITTFSPSLTSFSQSSFTPTPLPPPLSLLY